MPVNLRLLPSGGSDQNQLSRTFESLKYVLNSNDTFSGSHVLDARRLAVRIANTANLPSNLTSALSLAGCLYDIGKLQVPADLLVKQTPLTTREVTAIRRHVAAGYRMLREGSLLADLDGDTKMLIYEVALLHHERFDGTGYPLGFRGHEIPVLARIMAVADSFAAMTAPRPYRPALSMQAALEEIRRGSGRQFDPGFVRVLQELVVPAEESTEGWRGAEAEGGMR